MCGINALLGIDNIKIIFQSLEALQNRGYDSAGISCVNNQNFQIIKYASTDNCSALELLNKNSQ